MTAQHRIRVEDGVLVKYHGPGGDIAIPEGIGKLCEGTFEGCRSLKRVTLPASVKRIGARAFDGCPDLAIRAPGGSHAERYAKRNKIPFQALEDAASAEDRHSESREERLRRLGLPDISGIETDPQDETQLDG